ncbi:MAG: hypothetical protein WC554_09180 [Clostridia bacterium]
MNVGESSYCKKINDELCEKCDNLNYTHVSHPGGDYKYSVKRYFCELGHWTDDF